MRYFVYMNAKVLGPVEKDKLAEIPNFGSRTLVCVEREGDGRSKAWAMAGTLAELSPMFSGVPSPAQSAPAKEPENGQTTRVLHDQIERLNTLLDNLNASAPADQPARPEPETSPTSEIMKNLSVLAKELPVAEKNAEAANASPAPQTAEPPASGGQSSSSSESLTLPEQAAIPPQSAVTGERPSPSKGKTRGQKASKEKSSKAGLPEGWSRATFIVKEEYLEKLKDYSYWERLTLKEALDGVLAQFFNGREVRPRRKH